MLPDPSSAYGERVRRRLRDELVVWLTTVGNDGTPLPNVVWFLWDGDSDSVLIYNRPNAHRLAHIRSRPRVALHFNSNARGGDIVVFSGTAQLSPGEPAPHEHPGYLEKYREHMLRVAASPEQFSQSYPTPLRVRPDRVRGF